MPSVSAIGASGGASALYAMYSQQLARSRRQTNQTANAVALRSAAMNPSQPNTPVEPVPPVGRVTPDRTVRMPVAVQDTPLPTVEDLNNAADNLARMQIQYPEETNGVETADNTAQYAAQSSAAEEGSTVNLAPEIEAEQADAAAMPAEEEESTVNLAPPDREAEQVQAQRNEAQLRQGMNLGVHTNLMNVAGIS